MVPFLVRVRHLDGSLALMMVRGDSDLGPALRGQDDPGHDTR